MTEATSYPSVCSVYITHFVLSRRLVHAFLPPLGHASDVPSFAFINISQNDMVLYPHKTTWINTSFSPLLK